MLDGLKRDKAHRNLYFNLVRSSHSMLARRCGISQLFNWHLLLLDIYPCFDTLMKHP